jgi:protein-tyrosine phosphatase
MTCIIGRHRTGVLLLGFLVAATAASAMPDTARPVGPAPAVGAEHRRLLPLQGGRNFRDLGGYRAADGRLVRWGLLFRSGSMHGLTDADHRYLASRGIQVVCDFRDRRERAAEPVRWPADHAPRVLADDYDLDLRFMPAGDPATWTADQARTAMIAAYPRMLSEFNGQYRRMFAELLAGHAPLAFNCSAGKDRTGIAAALLLTALGVPRPLVVQDYLLTNQYLDPAMLASQPAGTTAPNAANPVARISPAAGRAMLAADPAYLASALAVLDKYPGGADGYLRDRLGLDPSSLRKLRDMYLSRAE